MLKRYFVAFRIFKRENQVEDNAAMSEQGITPKITLRTSLSWPPCDSCCGLLHWHCFSVEIGHWVWRFSHYFPRNWSFCHCHHCQRYRCPCLQLWAGCFAVKAGKATIWNFQRQSQKEVKSRNSGTKFLGLQLVPLLIDYNSWKVTWPLCVPVSF